MDKKMARVVIRCLGKMLRYGPERPMFGICFNLNRLLEQEGIYELSGYCAVEGLAVGWPRHTGSTSFPVRQTDGNQWEGEGLELRQELMQYMLDKAWLYAVADNFCVEIKSERSLRRYRAAGYAIQERWAGSWSTLRNEDTNMRFRCGARLRAVKPLTQEAR